MHLEPTVVRIAAIVFPAMYLNHFRTGSGEPLVLLHGIGSQWQVWSPVISRLASEREVIAIDLPGFGASSMPPPGTPAGIPTLTRLVAEFLDELGLSRPHVAGNSLGGWISLELAKQGKVRSATPLSPAGFQEGAEGLYARFLLSAMIRGARLLAPHAETALATPLGRTLVLGAMVARPDNLSVSDGAQALRALAGSGWFEETRIAAMHDCFSDGDRIEVPTTIGWGERDRLLLPRQAPRAHRAVHGSKLVMLTGCGHVPTWDDPDQVARVILEGSANGR